MVFYLVLTFPGRPAVGNTGLSTVPLQIQIVPGSAGFDKNLQSIEMYLVILQQFSADLVVLFTQTLFMSHGNEHDCFYYFSSFSNTTTHPVVRLYS